MGKWNNKKIKLWKKIIKRRFCYKMDDKSGEIEKNVNGY
jgi:hypothetical protein